MTDAVDRPAPELADPKELLLGYLDYYRSVIARKLDGLTESELRSSRLPSGWTPLELLKHLAYMEARWLRWGFAAEQLPEPWGDADESGRWHVGAETAAELLAALDAGGVRTRAASPTASVARRSRGSCSTSCRSTPATPATWTSPASCSTAPPASSGAQRAA